MFFKATDNSQECSPRWRISATIITALALAACSEDQTEVEARPVLPPPTLEKRDIEFGDRFTTPSPTLQAQEHLVPSIDLTSSFEVLLGQASHEIEDLISECALLEQSGTENGALKAFELENSFHAKKVVWQVPPGFEDEFSDFADFLANFGVDIASCYPKWREFTVAELFEATVAEAKRVSEIQDPTTPSTNLPTPQDKIENLTLELIRALRDEVLVDVLRLGFETERTFELCAAFEMEFSNRFESTPESVGPNGQTYYKRAICDFVLEMAIKNLNDPRWIELFYDLISSPMLGHDENLPVSKRAPQYKSVTPHLQVLLGNWEWERRHSNPNEGLLDRAEISPPGEYNRHRYISNALNLSDPTQHSEMLAFTRSLLTIALNDPRNHISQFGSSESDLEGLKTERSKRVALSIIASTSGLREEDLEALQLDHEFLKIIDQPLNLEYCWLLSELPTGIDSLRLILSGSAFTYPDISKQNAFFVLATNDQLPIDSIIAATSPNNPQTLQLMGIRLLSDLLLSERQLAFQQSHSTQASDRVLGGELILLTDAHARALQALEGIVFDPSRSKESRALAVIGITESLSFNAAWSKFESLLDYDVDPLVCNITALILHQKLITDSNPNTEPVFEAMLHDQIAYGPQLILAEALVEAGWEGLRSQEAHDAFIEGIFRLYEMGLRSELFLDRSKFDIFRESVGKNAYSSSSLMLHEAELRAEFQELFGERASAADKLLRSYKRLYLSDIVTQEEMADFERAVLTGDGTKQGSIFNHAKNSTGPALPTREIANFFFQLNRLGI